MAPSMMSPPPTCLNLRSGTLKSDKQMPLAMSMTHTGAFFKKGVRQEPYYRNKAAFDAVVLKLQADFFPKRLRIKEIFQDFDRLNRGEVSGYQFIRCLKIIMPSLSKKDWDALTDYCELPSGMVRYQVLLDTIEEVFTTKNLYQAPDAEVEKPGKQVQSMKKEIQATPTLLPSIASSPAATGGQAQMSPDANMTKTKSPHTEGKQAGSPDSVASPDNLHTQDSPVKKGLSTGATESTSAGDTNIEGILRRVALLNRTRGVVLKYAFQDFERTECSSITCSRRAGKITETQFRRAFPFEKDFLAREIDAIIDQYKCYYEDGSNTVLVDYMALHNDVTDPEDVKKDTPIPTSLYTEPSYMKNDEWSGQEFSLMERVTAKCVELRVRLLDYFRDCDPLRRGYCSSKQVDSVFGILGLNMFSPSEMAELKAKYMKQDLNLTLFHYGQFCKDVGSATHYDTIHLDPLAMHKFDSCAATMPSRRSKLKLTKEELIKIAELEGNIAARVAKRRMTLINNFRDFDRSNQGHVTFSQFGRVLQTLDLAGNPVKIQETLDLLAKKYGDLGTRRYLNYRDFVANVDPPSEILKLSEQQQKMPYEKPSASRYFRFGSKDMVLSALTH